MTFNVSDAERLAVVRSAVAKFAVDIMAPVVVSTETGTVEVVATLKGCREHVRTKEFLWRSSTAPPTVAAKDAEIANIRAEVDAQRKTIGELEDVSVQWMTEAKRLRADLDQARRDRNSAVECAEVLRGYVAEHKAALAAARAECERERMRLVACGVVAMSDTPDSLDATLAKIATDYRSASLDDVARTVRAMIAARAALDGERARALVRDRRTQ